MTKKTKTGLPAVIDETEYKPIELTGEYDVTEKARRYVEEYQKDWKQGAAAIRAGYAEKHARQHASRLMRNPEVQRMIAELNAKRLAAMPYTQEEWINDQASILRADPAELIHIKVVCCRHCHDPEFRYQFTPAEYERELKKHEQAEKRRAAKGEEPEEFDERGGVSYDGRKPPNPDCMECFGEGREVTVIKDSSELSPEGRKLFAGAKMTRTGIEILMHSQEKARENLGRQMGMLKERVYFENPLEVSPAKEAATPEEAMRIYQDQIKG